jgi:probable F420-dependent oxidoreductase
MNAPNAVESAAGFRTAMTPPVSAGPGMVERIVEAVCAAEQAGYDDAWLADAGGIDALTLAAIVLDRTERIRVGIAVVPAYTRTPAVLAATVATLADLAPGRFALGLGTSSEAMINGWHGLTLERPVARMRETLALLRGIFAGERTSFTGQTLRSTGYRQPALATPVPILLAALRPRMTELAVTAADGIILNLFPLSALDSLMAGIHNAATRVGKDPAEIEVASRFQGQVVVNDAEHAAARDTFRFHFTPYFANPVYNAFLAEVGYPDIAAGLQSHARAGDWAGARACLTDELVDEIAVIGDVEHFRARLGTYAEAGISTPIMFCLSTGPEQQRRTFEALRTVGAAR